MHTFDSGRPAVKGWLAAGAIALALAVALQPPALLAQPSVQGQWRTLPYLMPINPVHLALTNDGKVLVVAGSGNVATETNYRAVVWDPADDSFVAHALTWDMFCNGMVVLPDGRVFINGGNLQYDPFHGEPPQRRLRPGHGHVQRPAEHGRRPLVSHGDDAGQRQRHDVFGTEGRGRHEHDGRDLHARGGWSPPIAAGWTPPLYPRMHLSTDGRVFYSGSGRGSRFFNPATMTWTSVVATMNYGNSRTYGTSVLLPLTPANAYRPRVMIFGGSNPATATTEIIDLSAADACNGSSDRRCPSRGSR